MKGLWLCLHCPQLGLEVLSAGDDGPLALLCEDGERIALASARAWQAGVRPGMTINAALCLEPGLRLLTPDPEVSRRRLEGLALWCARFSARVSLEPTGENAASWGVVMEIASMLDYFGGLEGLWRRLHEELATLELEVSSATGHTPLAACLLARTGGYCGQGEAEHMARLGRLRLDRLGLSARQQSRLKGLGFTHLNDLLVLPPASLASRLGTDLRRYLQRLTGEVADPPPVFAPPPRFDRERELVHEIELAAGIVFPLRRLLAELEGFLKVRCVKALSLTLTLYHREGAQHLSVGHAGGEQAAEAWLELCRLRLESVVLDAPVLRLRLEVSEVASLQEVATDLFQAAPPRDTPEALFSRLRSRLGDGAVLQPMAREDHRPERASRLVAQPGTARRPPAETRTANHPAWLLEHPEPLTPATLERLVWVAGPERLASGWWDQAPARRDYHVACWPDGRHGWVFRDAESQWWLHGWFG